MKTDKYLQNVNHPVWKFMHLCTLDYSSDTSKLQINIFQFCSHFISFSGCSYVSRPDGQETFSLMFKKLFGGPCFKERWSVRRALRGFWH